MEMVSLAGAKDEGVPSLAKKRRLLLWDAGNTSSVLAAAAFRRRNNWEVDRIGGAESPVASSSVFATGHEVSRRNPDGVLDLMAKHPCDALLLHGDRHVKWIVDSWDRLPAHVRRHLTDRQALEIASSKKSSREFARRMGIPVLPSIVCSSAADVPAAAREVAPGAAWVVLKGEQGSAGSGIRRIACGATPSADDWAALSANGASSVFVEPWIEGPRVVLTVVYERGIERAACVHEKLAAYPARFGISALGITRRVEAVHQHGAKLFQLLAWHGIADADFRQDLRDGRWYFMEINPRVPASVGIQRLAGVDVLGTWASICEGGDVTAPGRAYREGVRYAWAVPAIASALTRGWALATNGGLAASVLRGHSDWEELDPAVRRKLFRVAARLALGR